jgi:hypothetical protein
MSANGLRGIVKLREQRTSALGCVIAIARFISEAEHAVPFHFSVRGKILCTICSFWMLIMEAVLAKIGD